MKNKKPNNADYAYVDQLKTKKTKPFRLRLQISGKRSNYYFNSEAEALAYKDDVSGLKDKVYRKGEVVHFSVLTLFREWINVKSLSVSPGTIANLHNSFKTLSTLYGSWLASVSKDDCLTLMKSDPSKALKVAFTALREINKYSLEKYNYGFTWNIDDLIKSFKPKVKSRNRVRSFYKENEIKAILDYLKTYQPKAKGPKFNNLYWYYFFKLSFSLGARIGEICSLKKSNYFKAEKTIIINSTLHSVHRDGTTYVEDSSTTKNGESRSIHLSASAVEAIDYFLRLDNKTDYLIPSGKRSKQLFLTNGVVNHVIKMVSKALGIIYLSSHCAFRKTFATQVAKASKKSHRDMIAAIQKQLGHKSPQMTLYYIQAIEVGLNDELTELDKILNPT